MIYEKLKIRDISKRLKNSDAVISAYIPSNSKEINLNKKRETIIICPGGGYEFTSDREAPHYRIWHPWLDSILLLY